MRMLAVSVLVLGCACGDTKQACESRGGQWGFDPFREPACNEAAPDAGKPCTDAGDCSSGWCDAPPGAVEGDTGVTGACCPHQQCMGEAVLQGVVQPNVAP